METLGVEGPALALYATLAGIGAIFVAGVAFTIWEAVRRWRR